MRSYTLTLSDFSGYKVPVCLFFLKPEGSLSLHPGPISQRYYLLLCLCGESEGSYGQDSHRALVGLLTTHMWAIRCYWHYIKSSAQCSELLHSFRAARLQESRDGNGGSAVDRDWDGCSCGVEESQRQRPACCMLWVDRIELPPWKINLGINALTPGMFHWHSSVSLNP